MPSESSVFLGPWGGEDGDDWNYTFKGAITHISITSDANAIRSISFVSDQDNKSRAFGTPNGHADEINIKDPDVEKLILMEGIVGTYDHIERVTQLSFTTSKKGVTTKYGPYGSQKEGIQFSCLLCEDPFVGFHGSCSDFLNSIGVVVRSRDVVQSWGGEGGDPWSYTTKGTISHIYVSYGDVIRALRFTSVDANGCVEHSQTFGDSDPKHKFHEIKIDIAVEKLNGIIGTYGTYENMMVIRSLSFTTNKRKTFGTFGKRIGIPFKYKVNNDDDVICGFYGQAGSLIDAIGVLKRPSRDGVVVGPVGNGGTKWEYQPKGLISRVILGIFNEARICTIALESKDEQGNIDRSPIFGKKYPDDKKTEVIIEGKLNGIEGTVGPWANGMTYIKSLYFTTDEKIMYGPFGGYSLASGDAHFSIPIKHGFISGFHGSIPIETNSYFLHSLGVYVNHV